MEAKPIDVVAASSSRHRRISTGLAARCSIASHGYVQSVISVAPFLILEVPDRGKRPSLPHRIRSRDVMPRISSTCRWLTGLCAIRKSRSRMSSTRSSAARLESGSKTQLRLDLTKVPAERFINIRIAASRSPRCTRSPSGIQTSKSIETVQDLSSRLSMTQRSTRERSGND